MYLVSNICQHRPNIYINKYIFNSMELQAVSLIKDEYFKHAEMKIFGRFIKFYICFSHF